MTTFEEAREAIEDVYPLFDNPIAIGMIQLSLEHLQSEWAADAKIAGMLGTILALDDGELTSLIHDLVATIGHSAFDITEE